MSSIRNKIKQPIKIAKNSQSIAWHMRCDGITKLSKTPAAVLLNAKLTTGWPKKVSHYQESSLNRIKNSLCG